MIHIEENWIAEGKSIKQITLPNRNNKKHLSVMLELNLAPEVRIPETNLLTTIFKIIWQTAGEPDDVFYYEMFDISRLEVNQLCDVISYASHGINTSDCVKELISKFNVSMNSEIALYFYKKINHTL